MAKKGEATKQHIIFTACRLFTERGYTQVTMQDICTACGLSKGGLYRHYGNKGQIFADILENFQRERADREGVLLEQGLPAGEILERCWRHFCRGLGGNAPSINRALYEFCMENKDGAGPGILSRQYQRGRDILLKLVKYGVGRGEFHPRQPEGAVPAILFLMEGLRMASEVMPITDTILADVFRQICGMLGVNDEN